MTKVERFLLKYGLKWLTISLEPYRIVEWAGGYPTKDSLKRLQDGIVKAWKGGDIEHIDAVRRFFATLLENRYGHDAVRFERVEVRGEKRVLLAYHTLGWVGNDIIIGALESPPNATFFYKYLERYDSGGHYYFQVPEFLLPKDLDGYLIDEIWGGEACSKSLR
jgi:hypothetical protein